MGDRRIGKKYVFQRQIKGSDRQLDDLFDIFITSKISEGRSPRTIESYTEYYRYFCNYLTHAGLEHTLTAVTPNVLRAYMTWMLHSKRKWENHPHKSKENQTLGLSAVTVNTKMKALKAMFRFLHEEGIILVNPAVRIGKLPEPENEIRVLTVDELKRLIAAPNIRTYAGFRDYVAIHVLIDSFARANEILSLKESSIDFKLGMVYFDAEVVKTRRGRSVPLSDRTLRLLRELIKENSNFDSEYLFLTNYGELMRDDRLRDRIKQHAISAGIDANVFLHLFRHTSATLFMDKGGSLLHLATIMGHKDARSTMRYATPSARALKESHKAYSPMNDVLKPQNQARKTVRKK